jgi:ubiquinone/menaquinone biosynthesis C-methylase UbiE
MTDNATIPNHHAHHPGFSGLGGLVAALSMLGGRSDNTRLAVELCGLRSGDAVVDIGCGPGAAARHAAGLGATVTGVDPSPVMLRVGRAVTHSGRVRYVEGSAEALPVESGVASVAWSIACVHHWHDVDDGIAEVRRVLRPGGRFVAIERARPADARGLASHGWTKDQAATFADCCVAHGFVDVRTKSHASGRSETLSVLATAPPS